MEYHIRVRCTAPNGETATYIADETNTPLSPLFPSLAELFPWMRVNTWKREEYVGGDFHPWRVVRAFPGFVNDYRLSEADSKRIKCGYCENPATTGQNNGSAPFWYHCDECAERGRNTGHFYKDVA